MNKVFLDPNTKYSDQYAMLAKLPEVVEVVNETAEKVEDIPEIPTPAVGDIGKVLGVVSDGESGAEYGAVAPASGLPAIESGDAGKVLTVNAGETGAEWASASGGGGNLMVIPLTYEYDDQTEQYYVNDPNDTSVSDLSAALKAGKAIIAILDKSQEYLDEIEQYQFVNLMNDWDRTTEAVFESIKIATSPITHGSTPAFLVTNKVLKLNNGGWLYTDASFYADSTYQS